MTRLISLSSLFAFFICGFDLRAQSAVEIENGLNDLAGATVFLASGGVAVEESVCLKPREGWSLESRGERTASFRQYFRGVPTSLGGVVFSRNASFLNRALRDIIVVFTNRGDSSERGSKLRVAIRDDYSALEKGLTSLLGAGVPHLDRSGGIGESGRRWNYRDIDIFLTHQSDIYTRLRFSPISTMANKRISDSESRMINSQRIRRGENGDVVLDDFPMIDQGSKGYCVPASWARVLQFMGIGADMYSLGAASLSETGGTDIFQAAVVGSEVAKSGGRRVTFPNLKPTVREIASFIDKGIPIIWGMNYSEDFSQTGYLSSGQPRAETRGLKRVTGQPHACIIIGYNLSTGEVAVTDSWGNSHRERWYKDRDMQSVSLGKFYTVEY